MAHTVILTGRPRIIGITGKAGSGKDTLARALADRHGYLIRPLAAPMKAMLNARFGWTMEQWDDRRWKEDPHPDAGYPNSSTEIGYSPRSWAQWLGTEVGRELGRDVWIDLWKRRWIAEGSPPVIIPDIRFDNEALFVKNEGGRLFQLVRSSAEPVLAHASEAGVDKVYVDHVIHNELDVIHMVRVAEWCLGAED